MTKQRDLKHTIRTRMKKTGERYTAARSHVLRSLESAARRPAVHPGLLAGYDRFGGVQEDTAILAHMFAHAGLRFPDTDAPYSEAMLHGLCGGVGFLYAVFEYKGWPPMLTLVPRSRSLPQTYIEPLFARVGIEATRRNSSSDTAARTKLDAALDAGTPALCLVDAALLPHSAVPRQLAGAGPHHVAVVGRTGDDYWLDDRALSPLRIAAADLAAARASYRAGKRALTLLGAIDPDHDWRAAWREALADTVRTLRGGDPTVPASFRGNTGLAGIEKWRRLLVDAKDSKGWRRVFPDGAKALVGLRRAYDGICHDYTAPAAGRPLYAAFLDAASDHLEMPALARAADAFRRSGAAWQQLADTIAATDDPAVQRACELADLRALALDEESPDGVYQRIEALASEREQLASQCRLDADRAGARYARLAESLDAVLEAEKEGTDRMEEALG